MFSSSHWTFGQCRHMEMIITIHHHRRCANVKCKLHRLLAWFSWFCFYMSAVYFVQCASLALFSVKKNISDIVETVAVVAVAIFFAMRCIYCLFIFAFLKLYHFFSSTVHMPKLSAIWCSRTFYSPADKPNT